MSDEKVKKELLAKIRARRDEINGLCDYREKFHRLFDDGAEFGPDKPEPKITFREHPDGTVSVFEDGRHNCYMRACFYHAIKRLGAEEAGE